MRIALLMAASLLALTACNGREAQDEPKATETGMSGAADGTLGDEPPSAQGFAKAVAMSDMYEVTTGRLALEKSEDAKTREFAQMMIDDHTRSAQALKDAASAGDQAAAGNRVFNMPASLDPQHQGRLDILERLDGKDFDREYLSQQMTVHREALELLKAYAGTGDVAELRQFAQNAIPTVQKHHDWLEQNAPGAAGGTPGAMMTAGATPAP
jgi:putative membrane protein